MPLDHGPEPMARPFAPPVATPIQARAVKGAEGVLGERHLLRVMADEASERPTRPRKPNRSVPVQVRRVNLAGKGAASPKEGAAPDALAPEMVGGPMGEAAAHAPRPGSRTRTAAGGEGVGNTATAPTRHLDTGATRLPPAPQNGVAITAVQAGPRGPFVPFLAAEGPMNTVVGPETVLPGLEVAPDAGLADAVAAVVPSRPRAVGTDAQAVPKAGWLMPPTETAFAPPSSDLASAARLIKEVAVPGLRVAGLVPAPVTAPVAYRPFPAEAGAFSRHV